MSHDTVDNEFLDQVKWDSDGLVPVIAQDGQSGRIMMMAWMNRESLSMTVDQGFAVYWSRSRQRLWKKGESSGHQQLVTEIRLDCDGDTIIMQIEQKGGIACHTGRESCFYKVLKGKNWDTVDPVIKDPATIYKASK